MATSNLTIGLTRARRFVTDLLLSGVAFVLVTTLPLLPTRGIGNLPWQGLISYLIVFLVAAAIAHFACRTYRMIWRYVSFRDLLSLVQASGFTIAGFAAIDLLIMHRDANVPASLLLWTLFLIWMANVGLLAAPRFIARALVETNIFRRHQVALSSHATPVLLSGDVGRMDAFIRECNRDRTSKYGVVGVISDDFRLHGSYLNGVRVLGRLENVPEVVRLLSIAGAQPQMLVLAETHPKQEDFKRHLDVAVSVGLKVGRLPAPGLMPDSQKVQPVVISDLLGRPEVPPDKSAVAAMIKNRRVLVTGAGGSIGSELCRQIASLGPAELITVDFGEFNLYSIDKELSEKFPDIARRTALLDVRDAEMISFWFSEVRPEIVFHAAALKHVPLIEDHPLEGVKTNVLGTIHIAEACLKHGVAAMVTISTDKAVNPSNVMGATKRLAESYCQGLDQLSRHQNGTHFVTVRFGNVLGSAGSVVPLFQRQIESGGPVTITHPDIKRYFMTIPEAVTLVLQAGARGMRPDSRRGGIYVLDMGQPVKIIDLARHMIQLSGLRPDIDIPIKIIGLRPGEKLYEEVVHDDESLIASGDGPLMQIVPRTTDLMILRQQVQELRQACIAKDRSRILRLLKISVPEFAATIEKSASRT